jgi:hypothetical protein
LCPAPLHVLYTRTAVDLIHLPIGVAVGVGSWIKRQLDVRNRETAVARRAAEIERKAAELTLLDRYDQEKRTDQNHGIELAIVKPSFAQWRSPTTLEFNLDIQIRNTWIYQPTLYKLLGNVAVKGFEDIELSPFEHELEVLPLRWVSPQRKVIWTPTDRQLEAIGAPGPVDLTFHELAVRVTAYLFDSQGQRFSVKGQLDGWLFVRARPTAS